MRFLSTLLFTLLTTFAYSQQIVYWIGGTPGKECSWHVPSNWDNGRVPNVFSHVIISTIGSGHHAQPVISELIEVTSIDIYPGSSLTISETGEVVIDGEFSYTEGILNYGGNIFNAGKINICNIEGIRPEDMHTTILGEGMVIIDGRPSEVKIMAAK